MSNKQKILVVDDEVSLLNTLGNILRDEFTHEVFTAENTGKAMEIAEQERPTLILCDYYMPEEDGFAFCKRIRSHPYLNDTILIMLTGASEISTVVSGFSIGVNDYVTKPFHVEELIARVKSHLRLKYLQEELKKDKLELARLNEELEEGFHSVMSLLTQLISIRVPNASIRAERAMKIAKWIGKRLGMDENMLDKMEMSAQLHEIGKIHLPDEVLANEYSNLSEEEVKSLSHYPVFGQFIVASVPSLKKIATYLRHQLENYDGTGYPDKLRGDEIPLPSRVLRGINLLEQFSTSEVMSSDEVVIKVRNAKGSVLDPRIALLLIEYIRTIESPAWIKDKKQVNLFELKPGMIIASDLFTGNGVKLLSKESQITLQNIERLLAHHASDPILNAIYIYKK